jgi:transposase InsO family protein
MRNRRQEATALARYHIVQTALEQGISHAARHHQCARSTVQRLVRRYDQGGLWTLCSRPRGPNAPVAQSLRDLIVELKIAQPRRSTDKICRLLNDIGHHVSRQTVWRVLSERGLARIVETEPLRRFEWGKPNDLWQLDLMEDEDTAAGKVHLVAALDDHSRFCLGGQFVRSKTEAHILGALARLLSRWGLPAAILTDRATCFFGTGQVPSGTTTYQLALSALGIRAAFAAAYKPRTKGKIEKFFQFVQRDFLSEHSNSVRSLDDLNARFAGWVDWYNLKRPHASLSDGTPARHFRPSSRAAPAQLDSLLAVETPRRVARDATIAFRGKRLAVPAEYLGKHVWLQLLGDQITVRANNQTIAQYSVAEV